jgi:hypothetical protein
VPPICRACGTQHDVGFRSRWVLDSLGIETAPVWLDALCNECLHDLARAVPSDDEGVTQRSVTEADLIAFLADNVRLLAARSASKSSMLRCEALKGGWLIGEHDHQCRRYGKLHLDQGRVLCAGCISAQQHGRKIAFVGTGDRVAQPFVIWARSRTELMMEAERMADEALR